MALVQTIELEIACDNGACAGNDLDPADRAGWTFVTAEVYGAPAVPLVYCCAECAEADVGRALRELEAE